MTGTARGTRNPEVLVVGAGPAGMAAATAAARHGRTVLVLDDNPLAGGQIWRAGSPRGQHKPDARRTSAVERLRASGATVLTGRRVVDAPQPGVLTALTESASGTTIEQISFQHLVLATGARERFLPFPGWTLPGVFGAGGLQALALGGFAVAGKRVVVAGTGPLLLAVAAHLRGFGAHVVCVAEQAPWRLMLPLARSLWSQPAKLLQGAGYRAKLLGVPYRAACWPTAALGEQSLHAVRLTNANGKTWEEPCDLLACGFHLVPNTELAVLLGCTLRGDFVAVDQNQRTTLPNVYAVGEPTGIAGLDAALLEGEIAGLTIAGESVKAANLMTRRDREAAFGVRLDAAFHLRPELRKLAQADTIVCRCEDVRYGQLAPYSGWTEAKLQTRCGMGPCQGRICGPAVQTLFGWRATSVRPPLSPMPLGCFHTHAATGEPSNFESNTLQETL